MSQTSFDFPLTDFEQVTVKYFAGRKKPTEKQIALAVKKCLEWNSKRIKLGLKPYE